MKPNFILSIILVCFSVKGIAQNDVKDSLYVIERKNVISIHPIGSLIGITSATPYKLRVSYERKKSKKVSLGLSVVNYPEYVESYDTIKLEYTYSGFKLGAFKAMLFTRIYLHPHEGLPQGVYLQGKLIGVHGFSDHKNLLISSFGAGFGAGYQAFIGKRKRFTLDAHLGLNIMSFPSGYGNLDRIGYLVSPAVWYTLGPGSLIDNGISIGYAF